MLDQSRDIIAAYIKQQLPALQACEPHGGRFSPEELKRWAVKGPAVLVALLNIGDPWLGNGVETPVTLVIYIIAKDTPDASRDVIALNLVQGIYQQLGGQTWSNEMFVSEPEKVRAQNLFSTELDKTGIAMWAITFTQNISLGLSEQTLADLNDFLRYSGQAATADGQVLQEIYGEFDVLDEDNQRITDSDNTLVTSDGYYREVEE